MVLRFTPVIRSTLRMLEPSASMEITVTFFSNGSLFAMRVMYYKTKLTAMKIFTKKQKSQRITPLAFA